MFSNWMLPTSHNSHGSSSQQQQQVLETQATLAAVVAPLQVVSPRTQVEEKLNVQQHEQSSPSPSQEQPSALLLRLRSHGQFHRPTVASFSTPAAGSFSRDCRAATPVQRSESAPLQTFNDTSHVIHPQQQANAMTQLASTDQFVTPPRATASGLDFNVQPGLGLPRPPSASDLVSFSSGQAEYFPLFGDSSPAIHQADPATSMTSFELLNRDNVSDLCNNFITPPRRASIVSNEGLQHETPQDCTHDPHALQQISRLLDDTRQVESDPCPEFISRPALLARSHSHPTRFLRSQVPKSGPDQIIAPESQTQPQKSSKRLKFVSKKNSPTLFQSFQSLESVYDSSNQIVNLEPLLFEPRFDFDQDLDCYVAYKKNHMSMSMSFLIPKSQKLYLSTPVTPYTPEITAFVISIKAETCSKPALDAPLLQLDTKRSLSNAQILQPQRIELNSFVPSSAIEIDQKKQKTKTSLNSLKDSSRLKFEFKRVQFRYSTANNPRSAAAVIAKDNDSGIEGANKNSKITDVTQATKVQMIITVNVELENSSQNLTNESIIDKMNLKQERVTKRRRIEKQQRSIKLIPIGQWTSRPLVVRARNPSSWSVPKASIVNSVSKDDDGLYAYLDQDVMNQGVPTSSTSQVKRDSIRRSSTRSRQANRGQVDVIIPAHKTRSQRAIDRSRS
ncbi:hypothetical protein OIO90_006287 [Microbotryomycetes sp. JL221]|nr:hypothetical protein OIO90_006287 [Microbotryomycetes sp. JL221]